MHHLTELNVLLAQKIWGQLTPQLETYVGCAASCIARLIPNGNEIIAFLEKPNISSNKAGIAGQNRDFLNGLRLGAKDIVGGQIYLMVPYGIDLATASVVAALTNQQIGVLSSQWPGRIFFIQEESIIKGSALHPDLMGYHAFYHH